MRTHPFSELNIFKHFITIFIGLCLSILQYGQTDTSQLVKYSPSYKFKEGIYFSFEMAKSGIPLSKTSISTDVPFNSPDFYEKVLQKETITYYDINGVKQEVPTKNIWGYAKNGALFVAWGDGFNKITVVGSICHFIAMITTTTAHYDPYAYRNPYYGSPMPMQTQTEIKQFFIDFKTGTIYDYNIKSLEILLMQDPELYDEFVDLKKKKQRKLLFFYLRKFNERNPLYLPKEY